MSSSETSSINTGSGTWRVTYRETERTFSRLDTLVEAGVFLNRSEAIREATRRLVQEEYDGE